MNILLHGSQFVHSHDMYASYAEVLFKLPCAVTASIFGQSAIVVGMSSQTCAEARV